MLTDLPISKVQFPICFVFLLTPLESIPMGGGSIVKYAIILTFLFWLFSDRHLFGGEVIKTFLLLALFWLFSALWAIDLTASLQHVFSFLLPSILLASIIGANTNSVQDFRIYLFFYLIGTIFLSVYCYFNHQAILMQSIAEDQERITAFGQDPNELSFLLTMGASISLWYFQIAKKKFNKLAFFVVFLVLFYTILSTASRTGFVMIMSVVCVFLIDNKKNILIFLPILALIGYILFNRMPSGIVERLFSIGKQIQDKDFTGRWEIWSLSLNAFLNRNIIVGVGYNNFPQFMKQLSGIAWASHNTYLSYLVCGGIIGVFIFIRILFLLICDCASCCKRRSTIYYVAFILPLLIGMLTLETQTRRWIFLVCILVARYAQVCNSNDGNSI